MQSRAEDAQGVCLLHDAGPAHRMRGDDDKRRETLWKRPTMANEEGFFPLSSSQPYSQKQEAGNRKLTEAREIWLSILIWLGSCSIGGEKGGPGEGGLGGGWRQAEGFVKIVMATFWRPLVFSRLRPVRFVTRSAGLFLFPCCCCSFFLLAVIFLLPQVLWTHHFVLSFAAMSTVFYPLSSLIFELFVLLHPAP